MGSNSLTDDEQWLQNLSATYARNAKYAVSDPTYQTPLSPQQETAFRHWVVQNKVPFNPADASPQDYDMRGYWQDIAAGGASETARNANDGEMHFPDTYKTPYHHSFSSESKYAQPDAPVWINDHQLADRHTGDVVWDERAMGPLGAVNVSRLLAPKAAR